VALLLFRSATSATSAEAEKSSLALMWQMMSNTIDEYYSLDQCSFDWLNHEEMKDVHQRRYAVEYDRA